MLRKLFLLAALATIMVSQTEAKLINLGPQVGFYKAQDADKWALMGGVACRVKPIPLLGAEASINYRQETYGDHAVTVHSWPVLVSGLIFPIPFLYAAVGGGWYNTTFDFDHTKLPVFSDETVQRFGWHLGGGLELPVVGTGMTVTGDFRYVFLDYDLSDIPGSGSPKSDFAIITIGVLFGL